MNIVIKLSLLGGVILLLTGCDAEYFSRERLREEKIKYLENARAGDPLADRIVAQEEPRRMPMHMHVSHPMHPYHTTRLFHH
jgi:hypothetical protein